MAKSTVTPIETKPFRSLTKHLPCNLNDEELRSFGMELAEAVQNTTAEEERQKHLKTEMKARLDELSARKTRLVLTVARGEEYRDVPVFCILRAGNLVEEVRSDTGESLRVRPIADEEKQLTLAKEGD